MKSEVLREIESSCDSIEDIRRKYSGIELDIYPVRRKTPSFRAGI